ncbi:MAG: hypothetical protein JWP72_2595 [Massilia sp.]|jgi:hypothetical protein|nr:hypothetical protein [Massilia sp.]MDB5790190.1 hypothetical protein [Massilia sp.]
MGGGYIVTLDNGKTLEVSRRHAAQLRDALSL